MTQHLSELGYVALEVSDLARWERFASEVLGLGVTPGPKAGTRLLRMDDNSYRILLIEGPADDYAFAGWQTANVASLEAFGKHLEANGLQPIWGSDDELAFRAVDRMLHFKDPAGNRHEVYCGPRLASNRFVSPSVASGFVTGKEGFGHLVYSSSEYAKTIVFAQRILGLGLSDQIRVELAPGMNFEVTFMHLNARHHSFAVAPNPPIPGPHKRIHHFMIEVNSVEEVGFARDRCLAMGQAVHMDIGQHPNDKMISFYAQTPSGFFVEFGWGGKKVDPASWQSVTYNKLSEWGHRLNPEVPMQTPAEYSAQSAPEPATPSGSPGAAKAVAGNWNVVIKTPMGDNNVVFQLEADGHAITGSIKGPKETNEITDGKASGKVFTWKSKVSSPMAMTIEFTANVEGDKISGGAKSPFGTAPFSGTRA